MSEAGAALPARFGVFVGRFQPPHRAHLAVMLEALAEQRELLVVLGSADSARTARNPFTAGERERMIRAALGDAGIQEERLRFAGVPDLYDMQAWARSVSDAVERIVPAGAPVALLGFEKDASSAYLREFPDWPFVATRVRSSLSATAVRRAFFAGDAHTLPELVPPAVERFLRDFTTRAEYAALQEEHAFLLGWHAAAPPLRVVSHALVRHAQQVLLARREELPGLGLWCLPGMELRDDRTLLDSALAALQPRGGPAPVASGLPRLFDHPGRSPLGREVAVVYQFSYQISLPAPAPLAGEWVDLAGALSQPREFYADHHRILQLMAASSE